jgi:hypothetical protein
MGDVKPWAEIHSERDKWPDFVDSGLTISFFIGMIAFWWFTDKMHVNFATFCSISIATTAFILMLLHIYRRFTSIKWMQTADVMRAILVGPIVTIIILMLNLTISGKPYQVTYTIIDLAVTTKNQNEDKVVVDLANNALSSFKTLRTFTITGSTYNWCKITYTCNDGLFDITNVSQRAIVLKTGAVILVGNHSAKNH